MRSISYRSEIDGLRAFAVIPVILYHYHLFEESQEDYELKDEDGKDFLSYLYMKGGFAGVDVFFVISGFLVTSVIMSNLAKQSFSSLSFLERRVRRLFPSVFLLSMTMLIFGWFVFMQNDYQESAKQITSILVAGANIFFYKQSDVSGYWGKKAESYTFLHFWSLAVEEQFYLVLPILCFIIYKYFGDTILDRFHSTTLKVFFALSCLSFGFCQYMMLIDASFAFYLLPTRAWEMLTGSILGVLCIKLCSGSAKYSSLPTMNGDNEIVSAKKNGFSFFDWSELGCGYASDVMAWVGITLMMASYYLFDKQTDYPGYCALLPTFATVLIIAGNHPRVDDSGERIMLSSGRFLAWKPFVWIGSISYSLYLWHWPLWVLAAYFTPNISEIPLWVKILLIIQTFLISHVSTFTIETMFRDRKRITAKLFWGIAGPAWIGLLLFAVYASFHGGSSSMVLGGNGAGGELASVISSIPCVGGDNSTIDLDDSQYIDVDGYMASNDYLDANFITPQSIMSSRQRDFDEFGYKTEKQRPGQPFYIVDPYNTGRICAAVIGSSIAKQLSRVIAEIALEMNKTVVFMGQDGYGAYIGSLGNPAFDKVRLDFLREKLPKSILVTDNFESHFKTDDREDIMREILDSILEASPDLERISVFGHAPHISINDVDFRGYVAKRIVQEGNYNFLTTMKKFKTLRNEKLIEELIVREYKEKRVKFFPTEQFYISPTTGFIQLVGREAKGRLLYLDPGHLTYDGANRLRDYLKQKLFVGVNC